MRGKTKDAKRSLSMCQEMFELLKQRRQKRPNNYWVFPGSRKQGPQLGCVRKAHDRVCDDLGLRGAMDLYNLRHIFATRSILSGTYVTILQKNLGHSEIGMTMRHVKIAEHYKVEAAVRLEKYRAVQTQEAGDSVIRETRKLSAGDSSSTLPSLSKSDHGPSGLSAPNS